MDPDRRPRTGRRWWLIPLAAVAALLTAFVLAIAGFFTWALLNLEDAVGYQPIDEKTAARAMKNRRVGIPDGFAFVDGAAYYVFSGADSYWARYRAPGDFADAKSAVAKANPHFPALRDMPCDDHYLHSFGEHAKLSCTPTTRTAVVVGYAGDHPKPVTDKYPGASDVESLLVVDTGAGVLLLVSTAGH
ncbi:MAG: hypothetical protein U0R77_02220 [Mycolicibacterium insubricum]